MTRQRLTVVLANLLFIPIAANLFLAGWVASRSFYRMPPPVPLK